MQTHTYRDLYSGITARVQVERLQPRGLRFTANVSAPYGVTFGKPATSTVQALVNSGVAREVAVRMTARAGYR